MGIDASIYQNAGPQPMQLGSPLAAAQQAMSLKSLGLQNQQQEFAMQTQQAMRDAYSQNTNPDGSLDQKGFLSDIGRVNPKAAIEMGNQFNAMAKQRAETQAAQADATEKMLTVTGPKFDYMHDNLTEEQRAAAWPNIIQQLKDQGIDTSRMDHPYDPQAFNMYYDTWKKSKPSLENQVAAANANKSNAEANKITADIGEIGDKRMQSLKDDLDPNKSRGGNLAKNQSVVDSADRLNAMFKQFPDYNIPKAQQTELVSAFGALLNGGSAPFVSQLEELVPKSAKGDANAMASWVTNEPTGAQQQKFMKLLNDSVNRERDVADYKVKSSQVERLSAHEMLQRTNPQGYSSVLHAYGIEPDNVKNGKYVRPDDNETDVSNKSVGSSKKSSDLFQNANADQKSPSISANAASPMKMPKMGDVEDGHVFLGGDPSKPSSWKRAN